MRKGYITNFFVNTLKHQLWIDNNELEFIKKDNTIFIIRRTALFDTLFLISTNIDDLKSSLSQIIDVLSDKQIVLDLVGNDSVAVQLAVFKEAGFNIYTSLHRMSRSGLLDTNYELPQTVSSSKDGDAEEIYTILQQNFDPLSEQLPTIQELKYWHSNNNIIVRKDNDKIAGFIIYELTGVTLYLRYWFVGLDYRDMKIGSDLFKHFLYNGRGSKRQFFWVIDDNENAIKRYKHYGFVSEKMYDYVLIK